MNERNPIKRGIVAEDDPRWPKLEKVWLEEGVTAKNLAIRFGMSYSQVYNWLVKKHGTATSITKRYLW